MHYLRQLSVGEGGSDASVRSFGSTENPHRPRNGGPLVIRFGLVLRLLPITLLSLPLLAQEPITATLDLGGAEFVSRRGSFEVVLSRPLEAKDGRIAILVANEDRTDLFVKTPRGFRYPANGLSLPSGEKEVVVYRVDETGTWNELSKLTLKVRTVAGFDKVELTPRLDVNLKGTLSGRKTPEPEPGTDRGNFQDVTGQLDVNARATRGTLAVTGAANVQGSSFRGEAIRFGTEQDSAPLVDLSRYVVGVEDGAARLQVGHVNPFGQHRHLMQGFGSRGILGNLPIGKVLEVSAGALSTTNIVGWSNITGIETSTNRLFFGQLAAELVPSAPGTFRLEGLVLDGQRDPASSFNTGQVTDSEDSQALALRLAAKTKDNRLRFDGGFTRARFTNPNDPLLSQGTSIVAVNETTRNARYAELSGDIVQGATVGKTSLTVSLALKHDRVDPLFRTVVAAPQADLEKNGVFLSAQFGSAALQAGFERSEDNLAELNSVLKTRTDSATGQLAFPFDAVFARADGTPSPWLPRLTYALQRTKVLGLSIPDDGAFGPPQVPDQLNLNHTGSLEWTIDKVRAAYRLTYADQDNRQLTRENADFIQLGNGLGLGYATTAFDVNLDGNFEVANNIERSRIERTRRLGVNANVRPLKGLSLTTNYQDSRTEDDGASSLNQSRTFEAFGTYRLEWKISTARSMAAQILLRYAYQDSHAEDKVFQLLSDTRTWLISSAVTLSLF